MIPLFRQFFKPFFHVLLFLTGIYFAGLNSLLANHNDILAGNIRNSERMLFQSMDTFSSESLTALEGRLDPAVLEARSREIFGMWESMNGGTRPISGASPLHQYIKDWVDSQEGMEWVTSFRGIVPYPVERHRLPGVSGEEPGQLRIGNTSWRTYPLWPNGPIPSVLPEEGLRAPVVYVGEGSWEEVNGKVLEGNIAVMEFAGGRSYQRLFQLGAKAVVVLDDGDINNEKASSLFFATPMPLPRFFIPSPDGDRLRSLLLEGQTPGGHLSGGHLFQEKPWETMIARIPAGNSLSWSFLRENVLDLVAIQSGIELGTLLNFNPDLGNSEWELGVECIIPGREEPVTLNMDTVWSALAFRYQVSESRLKEMNASSDKVFGWGDALMIPNAPEPLILYCPIDSLSVVPDLPHGGTTAANLASFLQIAEFLVSPESPSLRRDVILVFEDGDKNGGISSKSIATYIAKEMGVYSEALGEDEETIVRNHRESLSWFENGSGIESEEARLWFGEEWLYSRVEEVRIQLAEERIDILQDLLILSADDPQAELLQARVDAMQERVDAVAAFRKDTLDNRALSWEERLQEAFEKLGSEAFSQKVGKDALLPENLSALFREQLAEIERQYEDTLHNTEAARVLLDTLTGSNAGNLPVTSGFFFDLGDGSRSIGFGGDYRGVRSQSGTFPLKPVDSLAQRLQEVIAYLQLSRGRDEDRLLLALRDEIDFPVITPKGALTYGDFWSLLKTTKIPVSSHNDRFQRLDTPRDTLDHFNFTHLALQARTLGVVLSLVLEKPNEGVVPRPMNTPRMGRVKGKVVQFNIRSGIDANEPVWNASVYLLPVKPPAFGNVSNPNTLGWRNYRIANHDLSANNGDYRFPLENITLTGNPKVWSFQMDPESGLPLRVMNQGQVGTSPQNQTVSMLEGTDQIKKIVMSDVYPWIFFAGVDPSTFLDLGGVSGYEIVDSLINGAPQYYAMVSGKDFNEGGVLPKMLLSTPDRRVRLAYREGINVRLILSGELDENGEGIGYTVGPAKDGDQGVYFPNTSLYIAQDMLRLADYRQTIYKDFGITSQAVDKAVARATEKLTQAQEAHDREDWLASEGLAREAWGILIKTYPNILKMGREAVFSVVILMALLVPACVFLEKLIIGSKGIIKQLAGTVAFFIAGTFFLNFFHPAFKIAVSPFIVIIAFTMILMSGIVLGLCYQRFDILLRRARSTGGEVESDEISLASSLATALSLGVSNLKKRMSRTILTTLTVAVLTFSIVAFVSISGEDQINQRNLGLDNELNGELVEVDNPAYNGFLFRNFMWQSLDNNFIDALKSEFGSRFEMVTRAWYLQVEGGNNANREGVNQIRISTPEGRAEIAKAIMVYEPAEKDFSGLHRAVSGQQWFRGAPEESGDPEEDRDVVILPDTIARNLGIFPDQILDGAGNRLPAEELPVVRFRSREWKVIGILDTAQADRFRDVDGKSLALVDHLRSAFSNSVIGKLLNEGTSYHESWENFIIVPMAAREDVQALFRSVAVKVPQDFDTAPLLEDFALRLNREIFASEDGDVSLLITRSTVDVAGLAKIIVPILLCVLIVMNTMLGTVEERKGEVGMLGSIGLSPSQISFLLLSESAVFSVLGILFGVFTGLFMANFVPWMNDHGIAFGSTLSFNFTSISSMLLALGTGVVVLLATLIPARKASALAAPSGMEKWELPPLGEDGTLKMKLPFTLTRGNAVGMVAFFQRFLLNHTDTTSADFNCRDIVVNIRDDGAVALQASLWLAPYDLDVSQGFAMVIQPGDADGVFEVSLRIEPRTGSQESWLRTNYGFLDLVRSQFLIWRNLHPDMRQKIIREGAEILEEKAAKA